MSLTQLSDDVLVANFRDLVAEGQERLVLELEHIEELDRRRLFRHYASLWAYLVGEYGMEEWVAENRIRAARMLGRFPWLKERLETGKINLSLLEIAGACASRERLSDPEFVELLEAVSGMSCRAARREIASRFPTSSDLPRDRVRPLSEELCEIRFVAPNGLVEKLEELKGLLAHSHPGICLSELIDVLATEYRARHHPEEKAKRALERGERKSPSSPQVVPMAKVERRAPARAMIHELIKKRGYQCSYFDRASGQRCGSKHALEVDHIQPWAAGGGTEVENLRFLCRAHHGRVSYLQFGSRSEPPSRR